ncbi:MAG TPA: hypothetical protein PKI93_07415 [Alphaproteobacteria bacterium]|nr:hypothetical protein [Alphaproteobacteria bacterium]
MGRILFYTDGCAKPDGSSGLGCVIYFEEAAKIQLYSRPLSLDGDYGRRALNAEKEAVRFGGYLAAHLPKTGQIELSESSVILFSDCIRVVGDLVKRHLKENSGNARPAKNNNDSLVGHFSGIEHRKRTREFMPLADALSNMASRGMEIRTGAMDFKGYDIRSYLQNIIT